MSSDTDGVPPPPGTELKAADDADETLTPLLMAAFIAIPLAGAILLILCLLWCLFLALLYYLLPLLPGADAPMGGELTDVKALLFAYALVIYLTVGLFGVAPFLLIVPYVPLYIVTFFVTWGAGEIYVARRRKKLRS